MIQDNFSPNASVSPPPPFLSIYVITFNEEAKLAECLESVKWADELVVVDSFSTDGTLDIARRYTDRVYQHKFDDYGSQRNLALDQCRGEWAMCIDADERCTPELRAEIERAIRQPGPFVGYWVHIRNIIFGRQLRYGGMYHYTLRLWRRNAGRYIARKVHELPKIDGKVGYLEHDLVHLSYENISSILSKHIRYSDLAAQQLCDEGRRWHWWDITLKPLWILFDKLVLRMAWRDGWRGVVYALLSAHWMVIRHAKHLELIGWGDRQ